MILKLDELLDLHLIDHILEEHRKWNHYLLPSSAAEFLNLNGRHLTNPHVLEIIRNFSLPQQQRKNPSFLRRTEIIEYDFLDQLIESLNLDAKEKEKTKALLRNTASAFPLTYPSSGLFAGYDLVLLEDRVRKALDQTIWGDFRHSKTDWTKEVPSSEESHLTLQPVYEPRTEVEQGIARMFSKYTLLNSNLLQILAILSSAKNQYPHHTVGGIMSKYDPYLVGELFAEQMFTTGGIFYHASMMTLDPTTGERIPTLLWRDPNFGTFHCAYIGDNQNPRKLIELLSRPFPFTEGDRLICRDQKLVEAYSRLIFPPFLSDRIHLDELREQLQQSPKDNIQNPALYLIAIAWKLHELQRRFPEEADVAERIYNHLDAVLPRTEETTKKEEPTLTQSTRATNPTARVHPYVLISFDRQDGRKWYGKVIPKKGLEDQAHLIPAEEVMLRTVLHNVHYDCAGLTNVDDLEVERCDSEGYIFWTPDFGREHLNQHLHRLAQTRTQERVVTRKERLLREEFELKRAFFQKVAEFHAASALYLTGNRIKKMEYVEKAIQNLRLLFGEQLDFKKEDLENIINRLRGSFEYIATLIPTPQHTVTDRIIEDVTFADVCLDNQIPIPLGRSAQLATIDLFPLRRTPPAYELEVSFLLGRIGSTQRVDLNWKGGEEYHEFIPAEFDEEDETFFLTERDLWLGYYHRQLTDSVQKRNQLVLIRVASLEEEAKKVVKRVNSLLRGKNYPFLHEYFGWIDENTPPTIPNASREYLAQAKRKADLQHHLQREEWQQYDSHLEEAVNALFPQRKSRAETHSLFEEIIVEGVRGYLKSLVTKEVKVKLIDDLLVPHIAIFRSFDLLRKRRQLIQERTYGHASSEPEMQQYLLLTATEMMEQLLLKYQPLSHHSATREETISIRSGLDALRTLYLLHKSTYGERSYD